MTERSSGPDGPDDWGTDGYTRGQYYGSGTGGPYGSAKDDGYDAGAADPFGRRAAFGAGTGDGYRAPAGGYEASTAVYRGRSAAAYDAGTAGAYDTDTYEAGAAGTAGAGTAGTAGAGEAGFSGTGAEVPTATMPAAPRRQAADSKGFIGALFDFGFTSFVTPRVIKVLYVLIMIGTIVGALAFTITMFKISATLGILTLVFGAPLYVLIVLAIYRVFLEFFMVMFRMADDIKALRESGDLR